MFRRLPQVFFEGLAQFGIRRSLGHLRQSLGQLGLGVIKILQLIDVQLPQRSLLHFRTPLRVLQRSSGMARWAYIPKSIFRTQGKQYPVCCIGQQEINLAGFEGK
jgi:hypothetical protein